MLFEFVLFAILGWLVFANPQPPTRTVLLVVFVVFMVLWVVFGVTGFNLPALHLK